MKLHAPSDKLQNHLASAQQLPDVALNEDRTRQSRSATETCAIARALARQSIPEFTKKNISERWSVGADTVRHLLRDVGIDTSRTRNLTIPLTDLLAVEGVSDRLKIWALCSDDERLVLLGDLLTPEEKRENDSRWSKLHMRYAQKLVTPDQAAG